MYNNVPVLCDENYLLERKCNDIHCKSREHGDIISAAIKRSSVDHVSLCAFINFVCANCNEVEDSKGRMALQVAASCGNLGVVRWLISRRKPKIMAKHSNRPILALQSAILHGHLHVAVELIRLDISSLPSMQCLSIVHDGSSVHKSIYAWGANSNNTLGTQLPKECPRRLNVFHRSYSKDIKRILLNKYHSAILTEKGEVYTCGHGVGGRLGLDNECTQLIPVLVPLPKVSQVAISEYHSLFLLDDHRVFSCGLNTNCMLGTDPISKEFTFLQKVTLPLTILGIASSNVHCVAWNTVNLYVWGKNCGQMGYFFKLAKRMYIRAPESAFNVRRARVNFPLCGDGISKVAVSNGATIVYTNSKRLYIFTNYKVHRILCVGDDPLISDFVQICAIGGNIVPQFLDEYDPNNVHPELKIAALTSHGDVFVWTEFKSKMCICKFATKEQLYIRHISINSKEILLVSYNGEAYKVNHEHIVYEPTLNAANSYNCAYHTKGNQMQTIANDECMKFEVHKIPNIYRATVITSDEGGHNYAVIQRNPHRDVKSDFPLDTHSNAQLQQLNDETNELHCTYDMILKTNNKEFTCHKCIIVSKCPFLEELVVRLQTVHNRTIINCHDIDESRFQNFLANLYTFDRNSKELSEEFINIFSITTEHTNQSFISNDKKVEHIRKMNTCTCDVCSSNLNCDTLNSNLFLNDGFSRELSKFADVQIECLDNIIINAHKCLLISRVQYFRNSLSSRWKSDTSTAHISLSFSKNAVDAMLSFIYTNNLPPEYSEDSNIVSDLYVLADHICYQQLMNVCEYYLDELLEIDNVIPILLLANTYNAKLLKDSCFSFILYNIKPILMKKRQLNYLDDDLLFELKEYCIGKKTWPERLLTPLPESILISDEVIIKIANKYPVPKYENLPEIVSLTKCTKRRSQSNKSGSEHSDKNRNDQDSNTSFADVDLSSKTALLSLDFLDESIQQNTSMESPKISDCSTSFEIEEEFPLLSSSPRPDRGGFKRNEPSFKHKPIKISQKERKRLLSNSQVELPSTSAECTLSSQKSPWQTVSDEQCDNSADNNEENIEEIMSTERKKKENLVKLKSKSLTCTQIEERAIADLTTYYSITNEDEVISVERASQGPIAGPSWVPNSQMSLKK